MIVVKLGGSLFGAPELKSWLDALREYSLTTPIVIVPGGGPFADQVRLAQQCYSLSDKAAHHMAIIAMKQFGLLLADLLPDSQVFTDPRLIPSPFSLWLPDDSLLNENSLEHSWAITSDSIALWLASKLHAQQLWLIKSVETDEFSIGELIKNNIIDSGFEKLFRKNNIDTKIIHSHTYQHCKFFPELPSIKLP